MTIPFAFIIVTGVGQAIADELVNTEGGVPERIALVVPGEIVWDACDCGQLAQKITSIASSATFPTPANETPVRGCGLPVAVVSVTVSLVRCIPGVTDNGGPPSVTSLLASARVLEDDRRALRRAVLCYLKNLVHTYAGVTDFTVGAAASVGPEGQCGGVELVYSFGISNDAMCC